MQRKLLLRTLLFVTVALYAISSWLRVSAEAPTNTFPAAATYPDDQWHIIPGNTSLWYIFDYSGDRSKIEVTLLDGYTNRLEFRFYTPDQVRMPDQFDETPIGRGSPTISRCDTGRCASDYLFWSGAFFGGGTFYIQVVNPRSEDKPFKLIVTGSAVTIRAPTPTITLTPSPTLRNTSTPRPTAIQVTTNTLSTTLSFAATLTARGVDTAASVLGITTTPTATVVVTPTATITPAVSIAAATPTATLTATPTVTPTTEPTATAAPAPTATPSPTPVATNFFPTSAVYVWENRTRIIPENSELWFIFDYSGDRSPVTIVLPNGFTTGLRFRVFTMTQAERYFDGVDFVGEGTRPWIRCEEGRCRSNDLLWSGGFAEPGIYFIQVTNPDPRWKTFQLQVSGTGVIVGR